MRMVQNVACIGWHYVKENSPECIKRFQSHRWLDCIAVPVWFGAFFGLVYIFAQVMA